MKKIIMMLGIFVCAVVLTACQINEREQDRTPAVSNTSVSQNGDEDATKSSSESNVKYTGVYYTPTNSSPKGHIIKSDGTSDDVEKLFGYVRVTNDGRYAAYAQYSNGTYRAYCSSSSGDINEIAENVEGFYLDSDGEFVLVKSEDGIYYTSDFTKKAEKIMETDKVLFIEKYIFESTDNKNIYLFDTQNNLCKISVENNFEMTSLGVQGEYIDTVTSGENIISVISNASGGVTVCIIDENGNIINKIEAENYDIDSKIADANENKYLISSSFGVINIDGEKVHFLTDCSENGQYLVTTTEDTLYRYDITESGLINGISWTGEFTDCYVNNDGTVVAVEKDKKCLVFYDGTELIDVADDYKYVVSKSTGYGKHTFYYLHNDDFYKYTTDEGKILVAEDVKSFEMNGDTCYYITNWDTTKQYGDLYEVGRDEKIDDHVNSVS